MRHRSSVPFQTQHCSKSTDRPRKRALERDGALLDINHTKITPERHSMVWPEGLRSVTGAGGCPRCSATSPSPDSWRRWCPTRSGCCPCAPSTRPPRPHPLRRTPPMSRSPCTPGRPRSLTGLPSSLKSSSACTGGQGPGIVARQSRSARSG